MPDEAPAAIAATLRRRLAAFLTGDPG
jgi:hypothetical protein